MKAKKIVIGVLLAIIGLPVLLVLVVVVSVAVLDRTNGTVVSSGKPRSYLLYVPQSYDRAKPTPLVISMHGAAGWPAQQRNLSGWNRLAESKGSSSSTRREAMCRRFGTLTEGPVSHGMSHSSRR